MNSTHKLPPKSKEELLDEVVNVYSKSNPRHKELKRFDMKLEPLNIDTSVSDVSINLDSQNLDSQGA